MKFIECSSYFLGWGLRVGRTELRVWPSRPWWLIELVRWPSWWGRTPYPRQLFSFGPRPGKTLL